MVRLGVNIDHVATLRNARGGEFPCPIEAAKLAEKYGADGITAHLREDRRHIRDSDIYAIKEAINLPLNFEMAATEEMLKIALDVKPNACCLVPEKREEITTEGGLNVIKYKSKLTDFSNALKEQGIKTSLFIEPTKDAINASNEIGAEIIELHTGTYCHKPTESEYNRINEAAIYTNKLGIECHAGHGLNFDTTKDILKINFNEPLIKELNIGHFIISESIFNGLERTIKRFKEILSS